VRRRLARRFRARHDSARLVLSEGGPEGAAVKPLDRFFRALAVMFVAVAAAGQASAQGLLPGGGQPGAGTPVGQAAADPLGRQTPAGCVVGFLQAGSRADWARAARYLDTKLADDRAEELARQLKVVLDRGLAVNLDRLSRNPEGEQNDGVGKDRESIGTIESRTGKLDVVLARVRSGDQPPVWLFAHETLREVPTFHEEFEPSFIERFLPQSLIRGYGIRYMWWSWFVIACAALTAFLFAVVVARLGRSATRLALKRFAPDHVWTRWQTIVGPMRWLLFGIAIRVMSGWFLTLRQRLVGAQVATLVIIGAATWLGVTILASSVGRWASNLERQGRTERIALVRLTGRLCQATVVVIGVLAFLQAIGINLTPVLAGLGVGGIAVALASQKTLENLFGGMMVIGDSPVRIGNFCRVGTMTGTIEDIGLRSTRLRTAARTTISIPNADLASQSIENFATRDKMLFQHAFALRYQTTADQLRFVLAQSRALLYAHERVEPSDARVRLLRFGPSGLEVELFAYVRATEFDAFLSIQEDLLLRLMDIIESSGTALAYPSQTMYFARDAGLDAGRTAAAEAAVQAWREREALPFPDVPSDEKARLRGGVEYPPRESALRRDVRRP
jgi:MscS family membrane protein